MYETQQAEFRHTNRGRFTEHLLRNGPRAVTEFEKAQELWPAGDTCCPAADRACGYINFFTSAKAARKWADNNPAITGRVLRQAWALGQGVAEFGSFLRTGEASTRP